MMAVRLEKIILQSLKVITDGNILNGSNDLIKFTAFCVFKEYLLVIHQTSCENKYILF